MKKLLLFLFLFSSLSATFGQAVLEDERYVPETDPLVLQKLEQWQDIKFGLLMHWAPYWPPFDRNVNYDPALYPEKWETFVQFTHNQLLELLTDYGDVDILWLDGGWVKKRDQHNLDENYAGKFAENKAGNGFIKHRIVSQDIRMDELVAKACQKQPGLIVVDRAVYGKNQNYLTPENRVPEKELPYPWESCIISGGGWSYTPDADYMSGREGIQMLVDIVAKGGNLLLNIAPSPEGEWQEGAYQLLDEFGAWKY